jgi:hypothetical protein
MNYVCVYLHIPCIDDNGAPLRMHDKRIAVSTRLRKVLVTIFILICWVLKWIKACFESVECCNRIFLSACLPISEVFCTTTSADEFMHTIQSPIWRGENTRFTSRATTRGPRAGRSEFQGTKIASGVKRGYKNGVGHTQQSAGSAKLKLTSECVTGTSLSKFGEQTEVYCSHAHGLRRSGW